MKAHGREPNLYQQAGPVRLYPGDAAHVLAALPESGVDCVVTSPPYWGHRDYSTGRWDRGDPTCGHLPRRVPAGTPCSTCGPVSTDPQYGLEATVEEYVERLVAVFAQIRRVLAEHGTCWLNLGDSYSARSRTGYDTRSGIAAGRVLPEQRRSCDLPAKQLVGVPWRVAFARQAHGWWLRQAMIWHKPNVFSPSCDCCIRSSSGAGNGAGRCAFASAPDVVADAAATRAGSAPMLDRIRAVGYLPALIAHGLEDLTAPWADFDVLFLGGSAGWKLGPAGADPAAEALKRGKSAHMGGANSLRRLRYAQAIGCHFVDGMHLVYGPDRRLPELLGWLRIRTEPTPAPSSGRDLS